MKMEISVTESVELINEIRQQPDGIFEMIRADEKGSFGKYLSELMETELSGFLGRGRSTCLLFGNWQKTIPYLNFAGAEFAEDPRPQARSRSSLPQALGNGADSAKPALPTCHG